MLRRKLEKDKQAQTILEYTMTLGIVALVMFAMGPMIKRGTQSLIKLVAGQIGVQEDAEQKFDESGHLEAAYISSRATMDKRTRELGGTTDYIFGDMTVMNSRSLTNLGFSGD